MFKTITAALFAITILVGCDGKTSEESQAELYNALPSGCQVVNIKNYMSISLLVVVTCDGKMVTTTNMYTTSGKTSVKNAVVHIE